MDSLARIIIKYTDDLPVAKSFDRGEPVRTAQADEGRYFSQFPSRDVSHIFVNFVDYDTCTQERQIVAQYARPTASCCADNNHKRQEGEIVVQCSKNYVNN